MLEGAGAHWPAGDAALLAIIPATAAYAVLLVALFRAPLACQRCSLGVRRDPMDGRGRPVLV